MSAASTASSAKSPVVSMTWPDASAPRAPGGALEAVRGQEMAIGLVGRKAGMTRVFTDAGETVPVTVIEVLPNRVTQVKAQDKDGYRAVQVTYGTRRPQLYSKAVAGHFARANVAPGRALVEFRLTAADKTDLTPGAEIKADLFKEGEIVDVTGTTIGKGFAGTMKRHNFAGGYASHGNSLSHRAPGSIGLRQTPRRSKGMKLKLGNGPGALQVSQAAFGHKFNEPLVHQVLTAYRAAGRAGTKAQKSRAEVSGGGRKPYAQKGTGQARAGSNRSPLWIGGGKTFAAKPRDFTQKVNRKMYRGAIRSMLSELARTERLLVTDGIKLEAPKTKLLAQQLKAWELPSVLIVVEASDEKLALAARNLPHVEVIDVPALNPLSLAAYDKVLMTVGAVKLIEERLQ